MSSVIYAKQFLNATAALAPRDRKLVDNAVMEFARGSKSKGLRLHKLNFKESRFYSISANKDLRIIVLKDGDTRVVMHADHHDAAYRWAERHEVRIHEITQVPQIIEFVESVEERVQFSAGPQEERALFEGVNDEILGSLGVPTDYIDLVRKVRNEDDLEKLSSVLPEEAWEALVEIAGGAEPDLLVVECRDYNESVSTQPGITEEQALGSYTSNAARRRFWVAESEQALEQALAMPWAAWRVFLHPSQASAVHANYAGPARISGGAGTGKSVVLVHRAVRLVKQSPFTRVFLCTFSKQLAQQLEESISELISNEQSLRDRIDIAHLHQQAYLSLKQVEPGWSMASAASLKDRLQQAATTLGYLAHPLKFLVDEWNHVIDFWGVETLESYMGVSRKGRGKAMPGSQRKLLWPVFQHVLDGLQQDSALTRAGICQRANELQIDGVETYDHVLVDEAQDFGPREIRYAFSLVRAADNGFYLGSDDGQRIYTNPYPLTSIGINIRGRSRRLRVNYRTSAEIHDFSTKVLPEELVGESVSESRRVTSLFGGAEPHVTRCESRIDEAKLIESWIGDCQDAGISAEEIVLLARQPSRLQDVISHLNNTSAHVTCQLNDRGKGKIVVDSLHAAKGLEFKAVAIIGAEEGTLPLADSLDGMPGDEAHQLALDRERHLFYVGCTRARECLIVTYVGSRSRYLPKQKKLEPL